MDKLEDVEGIRVGGRGINNIRYADDTFLRSDSDEKLQRLVDVLSEECMSFSFKCKHDED